MEWTEADSKYTVKWCATDSSTATDWVELAIVPSKMTVLIQDVDYDSGRTADGLMHRNRVSIKRKLEFTFPPTSDEVGLSGILAQFGTESFYLKYFDPQAGAAQTRRFYTGDRSMPVYNFKLKLWDSMTFNVVEY